MKTTWILIANASEARLFSAKKTYKDMELIKEFHHPESREKVHNLISDASGRYRKNISPKSAFEEMHNPKKLEAEKFAQILAFTLEQGRNKNLYSNLILIAPSQFHGLLNKSCSHFVIDKVIERLDKDYTKIREHDLNKYLNGKYFTYKAA